MVFRINPDNIETFTLETNVNREVSNDTNGNFTGSLHVFPRRLQGLKEVYPMASYGSGPFSGDINLESKRKSIVEAPEGANRAEALTNYMGDVHAQASLAKYQSTASILRIQSQTELNMDAQRRLFLQKYIARQPVRFGQEAEWDTTNYHCLNFFTSSNTTVSSALIYPNSIRITTSRDTINFNNGTELFDNIVSNSYLDFANISASYASSYQLYEAFSFDFWIKPKYNAPAETLWGIVSASNYYRPGALLHFSSAYAITLHSGSSKNQNGLVDKFRVCLQLGDDADTEPGYLVAGTDHSGSMSGSTFWTTDNVLPLNEWTHVAITYGGHNYNQGTGSFWINGVKDRDIAIGPMIPVATFSFASPLWGALYVGNYYKGRKQPGQNVPGSGSFDQTRFWSNLNGGSFTGTGPWQQEQTLQYLINRLINDYPGFNNNSDVGYAKGKSYYLPAYFIGFSMNVYPGNYGDTPYIGAPPWDGPASHSFVYPLNAEVHDIKLWGKRLSEPEIASLQTSSVTPDKYDDVRFWLPPFFTKESVTRKTEPVSPFFDFGSVISSSYPFAARLALSTNGFYPNLENFLEDRATGMPPIQWNLRWFGNETVSSVVEKTSDQWLYENLVSSSAIRKRLYTVLPCDHGNFNPCFNTIEAHNYTDESFYNQFGTKTRGRINLKDGLYFVPEGDDETSSSIVEIAAAPSQRSMLGLSNDLTSSIVNDLYGARPENTTLAPGNGFAVWHRLQSADSHNVVLFDISNLYYGESIKPGSVELYTNDLSGSGGAFGFSMVDNSRGGLIRADADSTIAEWSTLGTVLYEEGIIIIKYPMLTFFGNNGWTLKFKGTRNIYVFSLEAVANPMTCTESADPIFSNIQLPEQVDYNPNEQDRKQVFIGSVLIHDENMNVIMRSTFSQPIVKKSGDKILTRLKIDF